MSNELDNYINKPVNFEKLISKIDFTEESVENAAIEHPKLFLTASRYRVQKMRDRVEAELAYEAAKAKLGSKYRERKDEKGKRTMTEGAVAAKVQLDKDTFKLRRKMEMSLVHEKFSELLIETYRKREFAIKIIIDARLAEAGRYIKQKKEEDAKRVSRKMMEEIRERHKSIRSKK